MALVSSAQDPRLVQAVAPVKPGDVLAGKYRVESILGAGGMGVVVAATHLTLGELVAVKFLLPAGFSLLALQGVSEIIKRIAALRGYYRIDARYERPTQ